MKKIYVLLLVLFNHLIISDSQAQFIRYEDDSGIKMGFNLSGAWQQSDMKAKAGLGFGFTFGSALSQKPGKFFAWDWAYRYQVGWNYGYDLDRDSNLVEGSPFDGNTGTALDDYKNNQGFVHRNYRVNVQEHNLELILTLNRLRERTGIVIYGWGGLGAVGYRVNTNQLDLLENSYNYSAIDNGTATSSELNFLWDNSYETDFLGNGRKWIFAPSAGIGIGYQFSPYFTMGWEHKWTFPRNDEIDGKFSDQVNHNGAEPTNDRFHYSGLYFRFHIMGGAHGHVNNNNNINNYTTTNNTTTTTTTVANTTPVEKPKPIVDFTNPTPSYVTVSNQVFDVRANVYNVDGPSNITFKHNGTESTAFTYSTYTKEFYSQVILQPGNNIFEIRGVNSEGYDYESRIVIYEIPYVPQAVPPVVTITNPPFSPYTSSSSTFNVTATVLNIEAASNISYRVNGVLNNSFTYNVTTKAFSSVINLNQGNNTIEIKATNTVGQDVKYATIVYQPVQTVVPPVVTITNPALNPHTVIVNNFTVEATVLNVASANDITLKINGALTSAFTYNTTTKQMVIVSNLNEGSNLFEITGTNSAGSDYKSTVIIYEKPQVEQPPVVTIIDPSVNPHSIGINTKVVKATVLNVASSASIVVKLNGNNVTNFNYNTVTKVLQFTTSNLNIGANTVFIKATNNVGTDMESTVIIYEKPATNPPPVVTITQPSQDPHNTTTENVTIVASVIHVNSSANVSFKHNGNANTNFTYDPITDVFIANITLTEGANTIEVKGTNQVGTATDNAVINYTKPCQIPSFSLMLPATPTHNSSAAVQSISVTANNISQSSQIEFTVNGVTSAFNFDPATHLFTATVGLVPGNNNVTISALTPCGSAVLPININYVKPVQPPIVTITNPGTNPYTTTTATHNVQATVQHVSSSSNVTFKLNGTPSTNFTFNSATTQFSANINLMAGANVVEITGTNNDGVDSKTTTIIYQAPNPPCLNPVIVLTQPNGNNTISTLGNIGVSALIQNISANNNIVFKQNGNVVPTTYDASSGNMNAAISLVDGSNTFEIVATNNCGSTNYTFSITYNRPLVPPVVTITNPSSNPYQSPTATTVINASIIHVSSSSNVTFNVNGSNSTSFTFDANTHQFVSGTIQLNAGNNTFMITGTNNDGTDSESTVIVYQPCVAPTVTVISPSAATSTTDNSPYTYEATVTGIASSSELSLTVGGNPIPFTFNASNGSITASISLASGNNVIVLTATNGCGSANKSVTVKFRPCLPPNIAFTHPLNTTSIEATPAYVVSATISGTTPASQITFLHNGNAAPFNFSNGSFSANVTLVPGLNNFDITATNDCGSKTDGRRVTLEQCDAPAITINSPSQNANLSTNTVQVSASIAHITNAQNVFANVNGNNVSGTFASGVYTFTANLVEGNNTIEVSANNSCGANSSTVNVTYTAPGIPPVVTITNPSQNPSNSSGSTAVINATILHVTSASGVEFKVNGNVVSGFTFNPSTHQFTSPSVTLNTGSNTFTVTGTNNFGMDTKSTVINYQPCNAPVVTISSPSSNNANVSTATFNFSGNVTNVSAGNQVTLTLNGAPVSASYTNGSVSAVLNLIAGQNTISLSGNSSCGSDVKTVMVTYTPCLIPTVQITSPAQGAQLTSTALQVSANVSNVSGASQIIATVNGTAVSGTLNGNTYSFNATLVSGSNSIMVTATNNCGSAESDISVNVSTGNTNNCMPEVGATFSSDNMSTTVSSTLDLSNVVLKFHDGVHQKFENLSGLAGTFAGTGGNTGKCISGVWIKSGCNNSNDGPGYGEYVNNNSFSGTCGNPPTVTITNPTQNPFNSSSSSAIINATVLHVANSSGIEFKVNGNVVSGFTFNPNTHQFTSPSINLNAGQNTFTITGTNQYGSDTKSTIINYQPCNIPVVTISNPSSANTDVTSASYSFSGTVSNVTAGNQITLTLNGNPVQASYNSSNQTVSANLTLATGQNVIILSVNTDCGTDAKTVYITYTPPPSACGPRFNPGNSQWEFCLITSSGTYTRDDLAANSNFTYSGSASSAYFKPIAGGGDAMVNGAPLTLQNGAYYHFSGNLTVSVSSNHPGSMGHWTICLESNSMPQSGNGNNRPASPCESTNGNGNGNNNGNGNGNNGDGDGDENGNGGGRSNDGNTGGGKPNGNGNINLNNNNGGNNNNNNGGNNNNNNKPDINKANDDKIKAEQEAKRKAEEEAKKKAEDEAKRKAQEDANKKTAEEEAKRKAQEDANKRAAELEAKRKAEEEAKRKAQEDANKKAAEEEAKRKADQQAKIKAEQEAKRKAEEAKKKEEENKKTEEQKKTEENKKEEDKKLEVKPGGGIKPR